MRRDDTVMTCNILSYMNIFQTIRPLAKKYIALHKKAC